MNEEKENKRARREIPKPGIWDGVLEAAKAVGSIIPGYGGFLARIFLSTVPTPLSRREKEFFESLNERLEKLEERGHINAKELAQNDLFLTAALQAYQIAMRNHQTEKLEALRNAVLNAALPGAPDESLQLIFLNMIDAFSPWHMQTLKFLDGPRAWMERERVATPSWTHGSARGLFSVAFKHLKRPTGLDDIVFLDLANRGLIRPGNLDAPASAQSLFAPWTTEMGKYFLKFITCPLKEE